MNSNIIISNKIKIYMIKQDYKIICYITAYNKYYLIYNLACRALINNNIETKIRKLNNLLNGEDTLTAEDYKIALDNIKTVDRIVYNGNLDYLEYIDNGDCKQLNLSNAKKYNYNDMFISVISCYKDKLLLVNKYYKNRLKLSIYTNKYNLKVLNKRYKEITNNKNIEDFNYIDLLSIFINTNTLKFNYIPFIENYFINPNRNFDKSNLYLKIDKFDNENYKEYATFRNILGLQND